MLENGTLVGETKKYYNTNFGLSNYLEIPTFPVAFDTITSSEQLIHSGKIEVICNAIPNFANFSESEREMVMLKVKSYYANVPILAETFTLNQLKGTPSFIIFDNHYEILAHYFGCQNDDILKTKLEHLLR